MLVVNNKINKKLAILSLSLALFLVSFHTVAAQSFLLDVYDSNVNPYYAKEDQEVTISGKVKLVDAPIGYHMVSVEWYVDDNFEHKATYSMRKDEIKSVSWNFDTSGLSKGRHKIKINASVDNVTDEDSNHFYIEEEIEIRISDLDLDPSTVCLDEDQTVELSVRVTLETGEDDTLVTAKFYIENNGYWKYIGKDERYLDEDETKTFRVYYDYQANDLDEGSHDVKVVVEAEGEKETEYSTLYVEECYPRIDYDVKVGFINLYPEYPQMSDRVSISVPITLYSAPSLPQDVYVKTYVDSKLINSMTLKFYHLETKTYSFFIDTTQYSLGMHNIDVKATVDSITDTSSRTFNIGFAEYGMTHCLKIEDIWVDNPLKAGETSVVHVKISNCGSMTTYNVKTSLAAFSKINFADIYSIPPGMYSELKFNINVPRDVEGITTFNVRVYDSYTSDTKSKDFTIHTGILLVQIKPEYSVKDCESNEITFQVANTGKVSDTFSLIIEGEATDWITGFPEFVSLYPDERKIVKAYVNVPCETPEGIYQFTVTAKNSQKYSASSALHVTKKWLALPIGLFAGMASVLFWVPWVFLFILIVLLYLIHITLVRERHKPMF